MKKHRLIVLACVAAALTLVGVDSTPVPGKADEAKSEEKTVPGKGKRIQDFIAAFSAGDAKKVAAFWTADGEFTDQLGHKFKGRAAIEKLYTKVFAAGKGAKLTINVNSFKLLAPEVGLEEGTTEVAPTDGGPPTAGAFSAVVVKQDGEWFFQSVHETLIQPPTNAGHFEELEWLIGDWAGSEKGESGTASFSWAENRNFIVSSFTTTINGVPVSGGTQWIGWDAIDKQIRSWTFYSGGGFGEAIWTNNGDKWTLKVSAKLANGETASAVNILTKIAADEVSWQITNLTVGGKAIPNPAVLKLKRVKEMQP